MSNIFDKIFKEESEILIRAIATKVLNIKNFDRTEPITATLQKTIERQPDWLTKICHDNPKEDYIFHGEVHGKDQAIILDRKLLYFALLWHKYHLPVTQVVVYIGRKKKLMKMKAELVLDNINFHIKIINMHEVPYDLFIDSNEPAEVILSVLCDFKGESAEVVMGKILDRLKTLHQSGLTLEKHLVQLEIISDLRNLQPLLTKIMDKMSITYDIRRDVRFKQGKLEGKLEGEQLKALAKDQIFVIRLSIKGIESHETIADFAGVSVDFVAKTLSSYQKGLDMTRNTTLSIEDIAKAIDLTAETVREFIVKK